MLDRMMQCEEDYGDLEGDGETVKEAAITFEDKGEKTIKRVKIVRKIINNIIEETKIEIYEYPNGERDIKRTIFR